MDRKSKTGIVGRGGQRMPVDALPVHKGGYRAVFGGEVLTTSFLTGRGRGLPTQSSESLFGYRKGLINSLVNGSDCRSTYRSFA